MIIKHQTGLKRLKLRELKQTLRLAFLYFKQSITTHKYPRGRTQPAPAAYFKKPHMNQSRRAYLFCDPPRHMAFSLQGTNEGGRICKQGACGDPCVCATLRGCFGADLCCLKDISTGYYLIGGSRLLLLSE